MEIRAFHIPVGIYCVPAAICALTGACLESVVLPALNRAQEADWLLGPVGGAYIHEAKAALNDMGWNVRRHKDVGKSKLFTWAELSGTRYRNRRLFVSVRGHAMALINGKVYDTLTPYGEEPRNHPHAHSIVNYVAMLEQQPR